MTPQEYIDLVSARYEQVSNPTKAAEMSAYMRNLFPYLGINKPERASIDKTLPPLVKEAVNEDFLEKTVVLCWEKDEREYQYFAIELLQKYFKVLSPNIMSTLTTIAIKKSWWDSIDTLATKIVCKLVAKFPELQETIDEYSVHENLWLRRIAIIYQIPFKKKTDEKRLFQYCLYNAQDKDFFIRKAIGWALRDYTKSNPQAVIDFVSEHEDILSPLSKREALRKIVF
jgi:3-methyladenine DNA glycosylase AlkD